MTATFDSYQHHASRTMGGPLDEHPQLRLAVFALGLVGEAGEVADLVKKHLGHGRALSVEEVTKELGDVLWYLAALATCYGVSLDDVAKKNIEKLRRRYPDGFSHAASAARVDTKEGS